MPEGVRLASLLVTAEMKLAEYLKDAQALVSANDKAATTADSLTRALNRQEQQVLATGKAHQRLVASIDPTVAAQQKLAAAARVEAAEVAKGNVTRAEASATLERFGASLAGGEQGMHSFSASALTMSSSVREMFVMVHEAISGRTSRIPGSLMVLTENMGALTAKTLGWGAAIAAAGVAAYEVYTRWRAIDDAVATATSAQVMAGIYTGTTEADTTRLAYQGMSPNTGFLESASAAGALESVAGPAAGFRESLFDLSRAASALKDESLDKTAEQISKAFDGGAESALRFAESTHSLTAEQESQIETLVKAGADIQAISTLIADMNAAWGDTGRKIADAKEQLDLYNAVSNAGDEIGGLAEMSGIKPPSDAALHPNPQAARDQVHEELVRLVSTINTAERKQRVLDETLKLLKEAQETHIAGAGEALAQVADERGHTHSFREEQAYQKQLRALADQLAAEKDHAAQQVATEQKIAALKGGYFGQNSKETAEAQDAVTAKQREAADQALRITLARYAGEEALAKDDAAKRLAIEDQRIAALAAAGKQGTEAMVAEQNRRAEIVQQIADKGKEAQLKALEQVTAAAARGSAERIADTEREVDFAVRAWGAASQQAQAAEDRRVQAVQAHQAALDTMATEWAQTQIALAKGAVDAKVQGLDAEVAAGKITAAQKLQIEKGLLDQKYAIDRAWLESEMAKYGAGTQQALHYYDQLLVLGQQQQTEDARLAAQMAEQTKRDMADAAKTANDEWRAVGDAISGAIDKLSDHTERWHKRFKSAMTDLENSIAKTVTKNEIVDPFMSMLGFGDAKKAAGPGAIGGFLEHLFGTAGSGAAATPGAGGIASAGGLLDRVANWFGGLFGSGAPSVAQSNVTAFDTGLTEATAGAPALSSLLNGGGIDLSSLVGGGAGSMAIQAGTVYLSGPIAGAVGTGGAAGQGGFLNSLIGQGANWAFGSGAGADSFYGSSSFYADTSASAGTAALAGDSAGLSLAGFADGGIMTRFGPLALRRYDTGGIADTPQLAMFGEGSAPEAFVPLPDGRAIPVNLAGGGSSSFGMSAPVSIGDIHFHGASDQVSRSDVHQIVAGAVVEGMKQARQQAFNDVFAKIQRGGMAAQASGRRPVGS